ncbi:hypothetical protein EEL30_04860 [Brevibacillus laterosporus]|uniref:Uncharacterized protein n=1 Tax=Brevibacillus laterosporus TaxID=1465 RepID=A0A518V448_BRELA|nr:hypothetical protein EEL30_04860 [Brevibacillus laterosporus]
MLWQFLSTVQLPFEDQFVVNVSQAPFQYERGSSFFILVSFLTLRTAHISFQYLSSGWNLKLCFGLRANAKRAWGLAKLKNLSLVASLTNDTEWQHELCAKLEKIKDEIGKIFMWSAAHC